MTTQLDVVNDCLAIMGEAPLNSIDEDHTFKEGALNTLARAKKAILAQGWWFNMETFKLTPNPADGRVYLPSDTAAVFLPCGTPNLAERGRLVYNLDGGTDIFDLTWSATCRLHRDLPIELCPSTFAAYISRQTVLEFQQLYDGDQTKTRNLMIEINGSPQMNIVGLKAEAIKEHVRNRDVNLIDSSYRVNRVRFAYQRLSRTRLTPGGRTY